MPSNPFGPVAHDEPVKSEAERKGMTRTEAVEYGKWMAELENRNLQARRPDVYTEAVCLARIRTAGDYAAWEYDGRLAGTIGRRV